MTPLPGGRNRTDDHLAAFRWFTIQTREMSSVFIASPSSSPDEWHCCCHDGVKQHVRIEWQARHIGHGTPYDFRVDKRFLREFPIGLQNAVRHLVRKRAVRIAYIDLAHRNVVPAAVERGTACQARDRMLRCRVGYRIRPRYPGRQRAVVDDAATAWRLRGHDSERSLQAEEHAVEVHIDCAAPLLGRPCFERTLRIADACIVEKQVQPTETCDDAIER